MGVLRVPGALVDGLRLSLRAMDLFLHLDLGRAREWARDNSFVNERLVSEDACGAKSVDRAPCIYTLFSRWFSFAT